MKGCTALPKAPALLKTHHQRHMQDTLWGGYTSAGVQLVYSTAPANWAIQNVITTHIIIIYIKTGFGIKQSTMVDVP